MNHVAPHPEITLADFCAGASGLGLGLGLLLDLAGIAGRTLVSCERDSRAASNLVARMEDKALVEAPIWDDLKSFDGKPWRGKVHCLSAGIPCQGNSMAGKRELEDDSRNLWPDSRRVIGEMGPDLFILENVPGILVPDRAGNRAAPITRICGELSELGYCCSWETVSAADVGASHLRNRVFIIGFNAAGLELIRRIGKGLADDDRVGRTEGQPQSIIPWTPHALIPSRKELADRSLMLGDSLFRREPKRTREGLGNSKLPERRPVGSARTDQSKRVNRREKDSDRLGSTGKTLADAKVQSEGRLPERKEKAKPRPALSRRSLHGKRTLFPPFANDTASWKAVRRKSPHLLPALTKRNAKSVLRRVAHGVAAGMDDRTSRLHIAGNGVVPLAAAHALAIICFNVVRAFGPE